MILELKSVVSGYPTRRAVLRDVSLYVDNRETVVIMGHNGAGKTTLLNTVFGLLKAHSGQILYQGRELSSTASRVKAGMSYCPQGQGVFPTLGVLENLELAFSTLNVDRSQYGPRVGEVFEIFPILGARKRQRAGTLSGGEQRMLSLGMAMMQNPVLLLLDEPSIGLAPLVTQEVFRVVKDFRSSFGMSILVVEQDVKQVIKLAERIYILKMGDIIFSGESKILLSHEELWKKL